MDGNIYNLDVVRRHLLSNYELLCQNHFIACITIQRKRVFTFDWQSIFSISKEAGYLQLFHEQQLRLHSKQMFHKEPIAA
jgi:hypothetical protein